MLLISVEKRTRDQLTTSVPDRKVTGRKMLSGWREARPVRRQEPGRATIHGSGNGSRNAEIRRRRPHSLTSADEREECAGCSGQPGFSGEERGHPVPVPARVAAALWHQ